MVSLFRKSKSGDGKDVAEANSDLAELLQERMGISSKDLTRGVRKAGRALPRRIRKQLSILLEAETMLNHPRLRRLVDASEVDRARTEVTTYLKEIDPAARRMDRNLRFLAGLAFNFLLFAALLVALLRWRGFI